MVVSLSLLEHRRIRFEQPLVGRDNSPIIRRLSVEIENRRSRGFRDSLAMNRLNRRNLRKFCIFGAIRNLRVFCLIAKLFLGRLDANSCFFSLSIGDSWKGEVAFDTEICLC